MEAINETDVAVVPLRNRPTGPVAMTSVLLSSPTIATLSSQPRTNADAQVVDVATLQQKLSILPEVEFSARGWKKSRVQEGWLIRRLPGYSISETEYGVSYLFVLSRKPDRTSADTLIHPLAGFFNWAALRDSGRLRKEKRRAKRTN